MAANIRRLVGGEGLGGTRVGGEGIVFLAEGFIDLA